MKALGHQLGRFVLVFNCDETFDFQAMGRIFVGLCQVGAWGCFDEFNRLEERMLSAVSQQIQMIQESLKNQGEQQQGEVLYSLYYGHCAPFPVPVDIIIGAIFFGGAGGAGGHVDEGSIAENLTRASGVCVCIMYLL